MNLINLINSYYIFIDSSSIFVFLSFFPHFRPSLPLPSRRSCKRANSRNLLAASWRRHPSVSMGRFTERLDKKCTFFQGFVDGMFKDFWWNFPWMFHGFSRDVSWSSSLSIEFEHPPTTGTDFSFCPCWLVDLLGWQNGPVALGCCGGCTSQ